MDDKNSSLYRGGGSLRKGSKRMVNLTEVKFGENAEARQLQGDLADSPQAELPVAKPAGEKHTADALGEVLTIHQVARLLGCSAWTVRQRYLGRGLPYFRIGSIGKLVFYRAQVTQWILEQQQIHRGRR